MFLPWSGCLRSVEDQAKSIMAMCPNYQSYALPSVGAGVSPRRLSSLHLWQMDVTHYAPFGCLKYIHVSIDPFSGAIFSAAHANEKTKYVIKHYLLAFSTLGIPQETKTYMSHQFHQFLNQWGVQAYCTPLQDSPSLQGPASPSRGSLINREGQSRHNLPLRHWQRLFVFSTF